MNYLENKYGKYIVTENNEKIYINQKYGENAPLYVILYYEYSYILKNMINDEFYLIQDKIYDIVKEIKKKDIVIGFTASNYYDGKLIVELVYILSEYRGKSIFTKELSLLEVYFGNIICLSLPNRFAIESLLKGLYAHKINEYLVRTRIPLVFQHPKSEDVLLFSRIYDLRICAIVDLDNCIVSPLIGVDIFYFDASSKRDCFLNKYYFENLRRIYDVSLK